MPNYKSMYFALFNAVTDAIRDLQEAQREAEESYIKADDKPPVVLQSLANKDETAAE